MNNIRYASIRSLDVPNGQNVGVSLFVQGCHFHCKNCSNPETWDFNCGKEWIDEVEKQFLELAARPYIKRISILGGEPLADENVDGVLNLVNRIRLSLGDTKTIWLYTGYEWNQLINGGVYTSKEHSGLKRRNIVKQCDVLIDGRYIDSLREITLQWRGSSNQRVIDVPESLQKGEIVLWRN